MTAQDLEIFGRVVQSSPARELVETAPHVFTGRGYKLEDIIIILDAYAHRGIDLSYGTLKIGMDLADAQWEIIRDTSTESVITLTDRLCFEIPKSDKAETNQGRALLKKYWEIYEAAKQRSGIKKGRDDQSEGVVNINALRSEVVLFVWTV